MAPPAPPPASLAVRPAIVVALCFAVAFLEGFDIQALGVAAPKLAPELGLAPDQMGWIFTISSVGIVLGASLGGWLADRVGRRPVLIASVLAFGVFTLAAAIANGFLALFLARALAGMGFGSALPNMMAVASEISPPETRGITASTMFVGMPAGGGSAALMTQVLPAGYDWRLLFVIGGALPLLVVPALRAFMPETHRARTAAGAARAAVGWRAVLFGGGRTGPTLLLWLTFFPTQVVLYLCLNWLPTLVAAKGMPRDVAPLASTAFNYASVAGGLILGTAVDRMGPRWPLSTAYIALIGSLVALAGATAQGSILFWSGAAGFLVLGANYALLGEAASFYPRAMRGTGSGAAIAVGRIGSVVGPLAAGMLLSGGTSAAQVIAYVAPAAGLAGAAVFALTFLARPDTRD